MTKFFRQDFRNCRKRPASGTSSFGLGAPLGNQPCGQIDRLRVESVPAWRFNWERLDLGQQTCVIGIGRGLPRQFEEIVEHSCEPQGPKRGL